jgi:hypothetical protein
MLTFWSILHSLSALRSASLNEMQAEYFLATVVYNGMPLFPTVQPMLEEMYVRL